MSSHCSDSWVCSAQSICEADIYNFWETLPLQSTEKHIGEVTVSIYIKSTFIATSWIMVRWMKGCYTALLSYILSVACSFVLRAVSPILVLKLLEMETVEITARGNVKSLFMWKWRDKRQEFESRLLSVLKIKQWTALNFFNVLFSTSVLKKAETCHDKRPQKSLKHGKTARPV